MKLLLDTHVLIWAIENPNKLSDIVHALMTDKDNQLFVSYFSLLEIKLKELSGKLFYPPTMPRLLDEFGIAVLHSDMDVLPKLQFFNEHNKDPFDNLLIATASLHEMPLLTDDRKILNTRAKGLRTIAAGR
jgi:PIN domain nuclease of toxin-antitoxin system